MSEVTKEQVVDYLSNLPVIQISELVKELEEKWGVSAAPVIQGGVGPGPTDEGPSDEKTEFDVVLTSFGSSKMPIIKEVRALTGLGLKEAKEKVESVPSVLKEGISKEEAEEIKGKIVTAGGEVEIK